MKLIRSEAHHAVNRIEARLAETLGDERYQRYFAHGARLRLSDRVLGVAVPSPFVADWLSRRFGPSLIEAARRETGDESIELQWSIEPCLFGADASTVEPPVRPVRSPSTAIDAAPHGRGRDATPPALRSAAQAAAARSERAGGIADLGSEGRAGAARSAMPPASRRNRTTAPAGSGVSGASGVSGSGRFRLDEFIVGACNRLAYSATISIAESDAPGFAVLFLHGECGLGKTHLLQGLAERFHSRRPNSTVRCLTGEHFANDYIQAVRTNTLARFRRSFRGVDLLCIDDVHFLAGKTQSQAEFLHTFDALDLGGARVAMASDAHPGAIAEFSRQLISRCMSGMVVKLERPDRDTREGIVSAFATRRRMPFDDAAIRLTAELCVNSVRELEGAVTKIDAVARLCPELTGPSGEVTAALVRRALLLESSSRPRRPVQVASILACVCKHLRVDPSEVLGNGRHKAVVLARSLVAYLSRQLTTHSFPEIARHLNRTNHSTFVAAAQRITRQIEAGEACDAGPELDAVSVSEISRRIRDDLERAAGAA